MTRSIRPSTRDDSSAIVALFAELGMSPNVRTEDLHWKYWASRPDWSGPRSYVLASDGEIIAHAALIPGAILCEGRRLTTGHVIDWVARRGQGGAGVALMKHIGQQMESLLAVGGSDETLRILPHIGFRPAGHVTGFVRPLHPNRILSAARPGWKILPRLARNTFWKISAPRVASQGWRSRLVSRPEELNALSNVLPEAAHGVVLLQRNLDLFRYVLQCPIVPMTLHVMEKSGVVGGYFLLAAAPRQMRIVDCWMRSVETADWSSMIQCAAEQASMNSRAAEVIIWARVAPLAEAVRACGFRARVEAPVLIRPSLGCMEVPTAIDVRMIDNDAAYFHEGRSAFLA